MIKKRPPLWKRTYFINSKFQRSFIKKTLVIAICMIIAQWVALQYIFVRFNIYGESLNYESKKKFYDFLSPQMNMINETFLWLGLITPLCLFLWGMFQSHRIAGPLHNLKIRLQRIRSITNLEDLTLLESTIFRRSDYFHEMAEEYNKTIDHLKAISKINNQQENNFMTSKISNQVADETNVLEVNFENKISNKKVS